MTLRPSRIIAIARRDLASELKGRRGWVLPAVIAGLLLPISGAPRFELPEAATQPPLTVSGDVPTAVLGLPDVQRVRADGGLQFDAGPPLKVRGPDLRKSVRDALDAGDPRAVPHISAPRKIAVPGRSLLFALISASTLTGALSASIGGERSAKTLVALLSAAVSRGEVIVGKWLAWAGLGAGSGLLAALAAILMDRIEAGFWLAPMVVVPMCAVAFGLWLVRRASDVIGGTTVTLRVLPAVVSISGLAAWFVGIDHPLLGAAIPLGGALVAAGQTWGPSLAPALLATVSTGGVTALLLWHTAGDLHEVIGTPAPPSPTGLAIRTGVLSAAVWYPPILGPLLWASAGNAELAERLPRGPGVAAGALGLALITGLQLAGIRGNNRLSWLAKPSTQYLVLAAAVGGLCAVVAGEPIAPVPMSMMAAQARLHAALAPAWAGLGVCLCAVLATEWLFRGWLLQRIGLPASVAVWTLVCTPLDPVLGVLTGTALGLLAQRSRSVWAAVCAHGCWCIASGLLGA